MIVTEHLNGSNDMGRLKELILTIEEELMEGKSSYTEIANRHGLTYEDVLTIARQLEDEMGTNYDESMDGDFDTGMASAGFGTDEDYGSFGDY